MKEVIDNFSFFGFNLYLRERIFEKTIEFNFKSNVEFKNSALHILVKEPKLDFQNLTLFEKIKWKQIAKKTIYLSIMSLLEQNEIELVRFIDKKSWFFSSFQTNTQSFFLKVKNRKNNEDYFLNSIKHQIEVNKKFYKKKSDIFLLIKSLLDFHLGENSEYNKPEKSFLIKLLKIESKRINWFTIIETKKMLGISKKYLVEVDELELSKIKENHGLFERELNDYLKINSKIKNFKHELFEKIEEVFFNKKPKSD